jgi:hypothetical protein
VFVVGSVVILALMLGVASAAYLEARRSGPLLGETKTRNSLCYAAWGMVPVGYA